jgi:hypothetical protein
MAELLQLTDAMREQDEAFREHVSELLPEKTCKLQHAYLYLDEQAQVTYRMIFRRRRDDWSYIGCIIVKSAAEIAGHPRRAAREVVEEAMEYLADKDAA